MNSFIGLLSDHFLDKINDYLPKLQYLNTYGCEQVTDGCLKKVAEQYEDLKIISPNNEIVTLDINMKQEELDVPSDVVVLDNNEKPEWILDGW